jgi:cob(I)alamin adenosyltransferase
MKIYTKKGDDGTTGLLFGGRVRKDSAAIEVNGAVDEAQAALGLARATAERGSELDEVLVGLERDLWVLMAEVATARSNRHKLEPGVSLVTEAMVTALEVRIDDLEQRFGMPTEFVVPGGSPASAALDLGRTVVRRAERLAIGLGAGAEEGETGEAGEAAGEHGDDAGEGAPTAGVPAASEAVGSQVVPYLNRLSDLCWMLARWQEGEHLLARGAAVGSTGARGAAVGSTGAGGGKTTAEIPSP